MGSFKGCLTALWCQQGNHNHLVMADLVLPDTHTLVIGRQKSSPDLSPVEAKRALLSGALRAFVGVHDKKKPKHLGVDEGKLKEAGSGGDAPVSFWVHEVPTACSERQVFVPCLPSPHQLP
jgi:hypothetical protein